MKRIFPGLLLIIAGGYLLALNFGMQVPDIGSLWPVFPTMLGIFLLFEALTDNRDAIFPATLFILTGIFCFMFTLGYLPWQDMSTLWPVLLLIMGLSFLLLFFVRWEWGLLVPTAIFSGTGLIFLGINLGYLNETVFSYLWRLWPLVLILLGVSLIAGRAVKPKNKA